MGEALKTMRISAGVAALAALAALPTAEAVGAEQVITLTQTGCQFVEAEGGIDRGFQTGKSEDCERINAESGGERLAKAKVLELKPGPTVFRVTNRNVPYELGFWVRESDYQPGNPLHALSKISVSGGGLTTGKTQDYAVDLKPGEYFYSCPLNPTPDYRLIVRAQ
jgi:hypothetical protein